MIDGPPRLGVVCNLHQIFRLRTYTLTIKTHGDVFKTYGLGAPVHYAVTGSEVTLCMEPKNLDSFMKALQAKQTVDAMASDGVKRETVKIIPLNKELKV